MSRFTDPLSIYGRYDREHLIRLWNLGGMQAIARGVFTPKDQGLIFLFVTRERENWMTQYNNFLEDNLLFWDGEKGHGNDQRIVNATGNAEKIYLFYRENRRDPFIYYGEIILRQPYLHKYKPSEFVFEVLSLSASMDESTSFVVHETSPEYASISQAGINSIDREIISKTRGISQSIFRGNLLRMWQGSCAVTGVRERRILRASHLKPWRCSSSEEKYDHFNGLLLVPNLDELLDKGLISFKNDGGILISEAWRSEDKQKMHISIDMKLRAVHPEAQRYLEFHRDEVLQR